MDVNKKEIYIYLSNINKLTELDYKFLISTYGTDDVHTVIDYIIDEGLDALGKFDYFIDRMTADVDSVSNKSNLDIYMQDIGRMSRLGREQTGEYAKEAYEIIKELKELFKKIDFSCVKRDNVIYNSIVDECQLCLEVCSDMELHDKIDELYNRFIYVRNAIVEGNIRLVIAASKRYFRDTNSFIEIIQWGNLGLMKAVEKYDPNFGTLFITYSYYWIRQFVRNSSKYEFNTATTISYNAIEKNNSRLKAISVLSSILGRVPTQEEIAEYIGISGDKLNEVEMAFRDSIPLSYSISSSEGIEGKATLADMIEDRSVDVEQDVCNKLLRDEILKILNESLSDDQRYIILKRFGFYGDVTSFSEIGRELGVSKQYIQNKQKKVLERIKRIAGKKLVDFLD